MLRYLGKLALSVAMIAVVCTTAGVMKYVVLAPPAPERNGQELLDELDIEIPQPNLVVEQTTLSELMR